MSSRYGTVRAASHAGDWYTDDAQQLNNQLSTWLQDVNPIDEAFPVQGCKAIVAPHAGYTYSGSTAAWAYKSIDTTGIKRVFILGPSHHFYLQTCALSLCKEYETPIGKLPLDLATIEELRSTGDFEALSLHTDEAEHSIEMHLPYIRKIFEGKEITIVPILVGAISKEQEARFGSILAPHLRKEDTVFVVSSDFCHWGTRFSYTYYYPEPPPGNAPAIRLSRSVSPSASNPIYASIRQLDHEAIEKLTVPPLTARAAHDEFFAYLSRTKNTICGRHPIGVLLGALTVLEKEHQANATVKWVRYQQSSACRSIRDSSVSYASAWVRI